MDDTKVWYHLEEIEKIIRRKYEKEIDRLKEENAELKEKLAQLEKNVVGERVGELDMASTQTQETVWSDDLDGDVTEVSPVKPDKPTTLLDFSGGVKRTLFDDALTMKRAKIDDTDDVSPAFLDSSQLVLDEEATGVPDSQDVTPTSDEPLLIDLTQHPRYNRPWYPEDFKRHPLIEKYITDRSVSLNQLPSELQDYYSRQIEYLHKLQKARLRDVHPDSSDVAKTQGMTAVVRPERDIDGAYNDKRVSNIYKYEINAENMDVYLQYYPNLLKSGKVRAWCIGNEGEVRDVSDDFILTQEVRERNEVKKEGARKKALLMLFHSLFIVDRKGRQVGGWIFKDPKLNEKVSKGEVIIEMSVFS